ncbi:MAG: hypothetical protein ACI9J3_003506 [Parvicellaceae bacterium]|jgi:hypothetical protein
MQIYNFQLNRFINGLAHVINTLNFKRLKSIPRNFITIIF